MRKYDLEYIYDKSGIDIGCQCCSLQSPAELQNLVMKALEKAWEAGFQHANRDAIDL